MQLTYFINLYIINISYLTWVGFAEIVTLKWHLTKTAPSATTIKRIGTAKIVRKMYLNTKTVKNAIMHKSIGPAPHAMAAILQATI